MDDKLELFKQTALDQGHSEEEVDTFLETVNKVKGKSQRDINQNFPIDDIDNNVSFQSPYSYDNGYIADEQMQMSRPLTEEELSQRGKIPRITQKFGNYNPELEKYSGGVNLGTDFAVPENTPLRTPPGEWEVIKASPGWNGGSGNYVKIQNTRTGETIGYEHLNKIGVRPGEKIRGGELVGLSGSTGNSTGPHASLPYQDSSGQYKDILDTPYVGYIYGG